MLRTMTSTSYRFAHGIILVFDCTDSESFHNVGQWMSEITKFAPADVKILLVGNKYDLRKNIDVKVEAAQVHQSVTSTYTGNS